MHESPPPPFAGEVGRDGDIALNGPGIDKILTDFREWLTDLPAWPAPTTAAETVDLATLIRQFTALRQEVNLQTRASRTQMEQNAQTLTTLGQAVEHLSDKPADPVDVLRPLLKSLIDIRDALALAQNQVNKTREPPASAPPPSVSLKLPYWTRWFDLEATIRRAIAPLEQWAASPSNSEKTQSLLESLAVGYAMSLQRLDRALEQHGLERIACVGLPFDPETMEVVEVVKDESRSGSVVLDDVRPGYLLRGQLFRCAQVRVARP